MAEEKVEVYFIAMAFNKNVKEERKMKILFRIIFLCLILACSPSHVFGGYVSCGTNCYKADSVSQEDVQAAIAAATASGGEVRIPAGTATYTTTFSVWSAPKLKNDLNIVGAGQGVTVIKDGTNSSSGAVFAFEVNGAVRFEMSGMTLISKTGTNSSGSLFIRGTSKSVLVHNMTFDMTGITGGRMVTWGTQNDSSQGGGVFYVCTWNNPTNTSQGISFHGMTSPFWVDDPSWGSANTKYVENCFFNYLAGPGDGAFDAYNGAKAVFRYNKVFGTSVGWHGNDSGISGHSFEIYKNEFTSLLNPIFAMHIRGGTALIYDNTFSGAYPKYFVLAVYRGCQSYWLKTWAATKGNTWCAYGFPGDGSSDESGYPCKQQPGTTGAEGLTNWPVIEWNNSHGGGVNNMGFAENKNFTPPMCTSTYTQRNYIKEERDFLNHSTCSDGVDNDGNGSSDMSDSRCATFWDNVNNKAKNYTPLTYPHPLRLSATTTVTPPPPPPPPPTVTAPPPPPPPTVTAPTTTTTTPTKTTTTKKKRIWIWNRLWNR